MKRLVLVRHAKAEPWGYDEDFSRALTERGESDARKVSRALKKTGVIPDLMISSSAMRALQTAILFASELDYPEKSIIKNRMLYQGLTSGELLGIIQKIKEEFSTLFLFGHNPTQSFMAREFCRDFSGEMPTCSSVVIDFQADHWEQIILHSGSLFQQFNPKEIPD
jgi:phosphohistidine phosphatase